MYFELSDSLKSEILFAMEDQTSEYFFDCEKALLQKKNECENFENGLESGKYVKIPEWKSADGYALLEEFTDLLHSPLAREDLKRTLTGGRGVFRNFKNVLKMYPGTEKKFNLFKDKKMKSKIIEWYNNLRESWGFEELESIDDDAFETDNLVQDDFEFCEYDFENDKNYVQNGEKILADEVKERFLDESGQAAAFLCSKLTEIADFENKFGFVCRSHSEDFVGCILYSFCPPNAKKTVLLTDFFVLKNFRGLGIGKELLSKSLSYLKKRGIQWILISNIIVPDFMEPLLLEIGFEKLDSFFRADLFQEAE